MMKNFNIKFIAVLFSAVVITFFSSQAFAFDWPQDAVQSDSFYSYFGQLRGGQISSSLIFKESSPVKASDSGKILAILGEHSSEMGWFESPLGNAVIVAHDDNLLTVYGNLDSEFIPENIHELSNVETGTPLGVSGNSGWQQGTSCLEFQVIDLLQKSAVNPRMLMPHQGREVELSVGSVSAVSKGGTSYPVWNKMSLPAGNYFLYRTRQKTTIPYKVNVFVNGALAERIAYDKLKQSKNRLCVVGNSPYSVEQVYPDNDRQLLASVNLSSGKNIITITVADILGAEKTVEYTVYVKGTSKN